VKDIEVCKTFFNATPNAQRRLIGFGLECPLPRRSWNSVLVSPPAISMTVAQQLLWVRRIRLDGLSRQAKLADRFEDALTCGSVA
jgi:hypothetical protein